LQNGKKEVKEVSVKLQCKEAVEVKAVIELEIQGNLPVYE
jgi:hypothetical protein